MLNKNYGLACQSEQSLEGSHKVCFCSVGLNKLTVKLQVERSDRENLARKTCLVDNLTDVFRHKWADSDPVLRSFDRKVRFLPYILNISSCHGAMSGFNYTL